MKDVSLTLVFPMTEKSFMGYISFYIEILVQKRVVTYSSQMAAFEDFIPTSVLDSYAFIGTASVEI